MTSRFFIFITIFFIFTSRALAGDRMELFMNAIISAGKIEAINDFCPVTGDSLARPEDENLTEQILEGFELENPDEQQKRKLLSASKDAYREKTENLEKNEDVDCKFSQFLWEKEALYKELLGHLKAISRSRRSGDRI